MTRDATPPEAEARAAEPARDRAAATAIPADATAVLRLDGDETWAPQPPPVAMPSGSVVYEILRERARGSMGLIQEARDPVLQRRVALKLLDPTAPIPNAEARFLDEARITAQLQHPSVVAVHALGTDDLGRPFFTMQLVEGRTLRDILDGLTRRVPGDVRRFSRKRLVQMVMQICNSLAYAHSRGVIHRDLKPENIMLGEFGEVFVMDWGLAKIVRTDVPDPVVGGRPEGGVFQTRAGEITGTPSYMAPEQALGLVDALGPRSDIFSVGAILYEIMALRPPFTGTDARDVLRQAQRAPIRPLSEVAPEADIPPALEGVVMTCLARDPSDRYADATTLRDELEACLTGGRTVLRKVRDAARQVREASRVAQQFQDLARQRRRLAREVQTALALRLPFDPPDEVEASWALADDLADLDREAAAKFEAAVGLYHEVLAEEPQHPTAHEGLRDLLWYRFLEAERMGDTAAMAVYRSLALQHDPPRGGVPGERDPGSLRAAAEGMGGLRVTGAGSWTLMRFVLRARRLVAEPVAAEESLPMGSYLIEALGDHGGTLRIPVEVGRQEVAEITLVFPPPDLPSELAFVPAGAGWQGSDATFVVSLPRVRVAQPAFAIARTPVTVAEYADYVNAADAGARRGLLPPEAAWSAGQDGRLHPDQHGQNPITGLSLAQVRAYLAWRRERDGRAWRLPSAAEWEKAARGVDGRAFPWGDAWEPSFCRCAEGPEGGAPSPVGSETDRSPYGVQDLAGGVREWTSTEHPRDARRRAVKGGSFLTGRAECHLAAVSFRKIDQGAPDLGFRLALDI